MPEMPERLGVPPTEDDRNGDSPAFEQGDSASANSESASPAKSVGGTAQPKHGAIVAKRIVIPPDAKRVKRRSAERLQQEKKEQELSQFPAPSPVETRATEPSASDVAPTETRATTETATGSAPVTLQESAPVEAPSQTVPTPGQLKRFTDRATDAAAQSLAASSIVTPAAPVSVAPPVRDASSSGAAAQAETYKSSGTIFSKEAKSLPTVPQYPELNAPRRGRLELLLWALAAILVLVAAVVAIPILFPDALNGTGITIPNPFANPTTVGLVVNTPVPARTTATRAAAPTETTLPTDVPTRTPQPTLAPIVLPTAPADGQVLSLVPDPDFTGWVANNEPEAHWGDPNLFAGTLEGTTYSTIVQFDLNNLPPGTQVLFAALELTGRDARRLAEGGEWSVEILDPQGMQEARKLNGAELIAAPALGTLSEHLGAADLGQGKINRFVLDEAQLKLLEQQFAQGRAAFRIVGSANDGGGVFGWEAGIGGSALSAPALYLVVVPGDWLAIVTNTPVPENVLTAAAIAVRGTAQATRFGTPTDFPPGVVTATPGGEPFKVPAGTAIAGNTATAIARAIEATAVARTTGTYTPTPKNVVIVFPTSTPVLRNPNELATATPVPPDADMLQVPIDYARCQCQGRIIAMSNRILGGDQFSPIVLDPDGSLIGQLSSNLFYRAALARETYSPDLKQRIVYPTDSNGTQQIGILDSETNTTKFITNFPKGISYDAAWAPDGSAIAFVATERGNTDEIYVYDFGTEKITRITDSAELGQPWNKRPTWSPNSKQIAFWSSRSGNQQIWIMNRDGTGLENISKNKFSEKDPVWVK